MKIKVATLFFILLAACTAPKNSSRLGYAKQQTSTSFKNKTSGGKSTGTNNRISIKTTGEVSGSGPGTKVVFKGSNNLLEVVQHNPTFFDNAQDVIVIEGNGNHIKLYSRHLVDVKGNNQTDTLVLVGNQKKYVVDFYNSVQLKQAPTSIDTVVMETKPLQASTFTQGLEENTHGLELVKELLSNIAKGDEEAYMALAEIYHYGMHNVVSSTPKAVELYGFAATKGDLEAIKRLGDIWANGTFDLKPDLPKARYYYHLGAQLGDAYCKEQLGHK